MKYFVFSDVHGCFDDLMKALEKAGYDERNEDHYLLFLGDAFDHNDTGHYKMYEFLKRSIENNKLKWILGNHEIYLLNTLENEHSSKQTIKTIRDIAIGLDPNAINYDDVECIRVLKKNDVDKFISGNCVDFFETEKYVFTHGFIPYDRKAFKYDENWRNVPTTNFNLYRGYNGQKLVIKGIRIPNKTLVCGHVGAYYGYIVKNHPELGIDTKEFKKLANKIMKNSTTDKKPFDIYYGDGVIGIDTRSYDTHNVNVLIVED